jgi:hypothetical protein
MATEFERDAYEKSQDAVNLAPLPLSGMFFFSLKLANSSFAAEPIWGHVSGKAHSDSRVEEEADGRGRDEDEE